MADYTEYEERLFSYVAEHGWQFTYVFDPEGLSPDFGYSVGMTQSLEAPEFVVFGLPKNLMNQMIWEVFRQVKGGLIPTDGTRVEGLLEGFECVLRKADHKDLYSDYVVSADWFWKETGNTEHPDVYQIVWPGAKQALYPWDDGCVQDVIDAQPRLWR